MVYSMQIKLKDESMLPFVDSVFLKEGFKKEIKPDGELIYSVEGSKSYNKMLIALEPLDESAVVANCEKWLWLESKDGICVYQEDCLKELKEYYAQ